MTPTSSRPRRLLAWMRSHRWRTAGIAALLAFALLNVVVYQHAQAMLTYRADGVRTPPPQSLSAWQKLQVLACGVRIPRPENTNSPLTLVLPFETVRFSARDGVELEGWLLVPPHPTGTVALFHGYGGCRSMLLGEAHAFYNRGLAVVLIDFRGSGGSDGHTTTIGYREAEDVAATVQFIRSRDLPRPLILYGQSMGAAAILRSIAALGVEADGVILESVFDRMLGAVRNRFALMGVPSFPSAELLVFWGGVQAGFSGFAHNPVDYAPACRCPTLVLHGSEDRHALPAEATNVYEHLSGPKQLVIFPDAGHTSLFATAPDRWHSAVNEFVKSL